MVPRILTVASLFLVVACAAGSDGSGAGAGAPGGSGAGSAEGGSTESFGSAVGGGYGEGGGMECKPCSDDFTQVLNCDGTVKEICPPDQLCGAPGVCMAPCDAASANKSSVGCDYHPVTMNAMGGAFGGCFVAFIANTWHELRRRERVPRRRLRVAPHSAQHDARRARGRDERDDPPQGRDPGRVERRGRPGESAGHLRPRRGRHDRVHADGGAHGQPDPVVGAHRRLRGPPRAPRPVRRPVERPRRAADPAGARARPRVRGGRPPRAGRGHPGEEVAPPGRRGRRHGPHLRPAGPGSAFDARARRRVRLRSAGAFVVRSQDDDHPFMVFSYMSSSDNIASAGGPAGYGDSDFVRIVAGQQYLRRYVFFTDPTSPATNLVAVRRKTDQGFADVELDCAGVLSGWQPLGSKGGYEFVRVDLSRHDLEPQGACDNGRREMSSDGRSA